MRYIILSVIAGFILFSCGSNYQADISGHIAEASKTTVYLELMNVDNAIIVDSAKTNRKGEFRFKVSLKEPLFYTIKIGSENIPLLVEPGQHIQINGELKNLNNNYSTLGSEGSELIKTLNIRRKRTVQTMDSLQKLYTALPQGNAQDKERILLANEWDSTFKQQVKFSKDFIITYIQSPVAYYALYQKIDRENFILDPIQEQYSYRAVATTMQAQYPESQYTKALLAHIKRILTELKTQKVRDLVNSAENQLPEISLPDLKGNMIHLSSLRGKYIILDFTVLSTENGEAYIKDMKRVYNKFRHRGVEIYQVCLDPTKLLWEELVQRYGIDWKCVWDSAGADSKAALLWNIQNIPANYIIDKKYEIVGKDLSGQRLEDRLNDILKK
ncbi:AhpC/TSA family protein [Odoribacter sp. OttesenSCG-928-J03]|nr:AhpC/TSA family protein [Odoribacter sp. OttesenSCG-928-J03]MDL2283153.1 AhpC/TSA family protein [Odoribacter sp. OttesenSCG-928-G04]MDL2330509.1 AhpC/TSA family protein [Odoribacter sp. OttesenSCG-928-A06]